MEFFSCLLEGKPIPTELRKDEAALRKAIEFDDEKHERKLYIHVHAKLYIRFSDLWSEWSITASLWMVSWLPSQKDLLEFLVLMMHVQRKEWIMTCLQKNIKTNIAPIKMSDLHVSAMNRKYIVSNTHVYKSLVDFLKLFHYQMLPNPIHLNQTQSCMYVIEFDWWNIWFVSITCSYNVCTVRKIQFRLVMVQTNDSPVCWLQ